MKYRFFGRLLTFIVSAFLLVFTPQFNAIAAPVEEIKEEEGRGEIHPDCDKCPALLPTGTASCTPNGAVNKQCSYTFTCSAGYMAVSGTVLVDPKEVPESPCVSQGGQSTVGRSCGAGYYVPAGETECTPCPAGKYCSGWDETQQFPKASDYGIGGNISAGYYSSGGAKIAAPTTSSHCLSGYSCGACPSNWTSVAGSNTSINKCYRSVTLNKNSASGSLTLPSNSGCGSITTNSGTTSATLSVYYDTNCTFPVTTGLTKTKTVMTGGYGTTSSNTSTTRTFKITGTGSSITYYVGQSACSCTCGSSNHCSSCTVSGVSSNACQFSVTCQSGYSGSGTQTAQAGTGAYTAVCGAASYKCNSGTYLPAGATSCATCPAGYYCQGSIYAYNPNIDQGLNTVDAGYYCTGGCNTFSPSSSTDCPGYSCGLIAAGYYSSGGGKTATPTSSSDCVEGNCGVIAAGYYSTGGCRKHEPNSDACVSGQACGPVNAGYYSTGGGTTATGACLSGYSCGDCNDVNYSQSCTVSNGGGTQSCHYTSGPSGATSSSQCTTPSCGSCKIEYCAAGYYTTGDSCATVGDGDYSPANDPDSYSCATYAGSAYTHSSSPRSSINNCYRSCATTDVGNSASVSGTYYYSGSNTCAATSCAAGYYLSNGACTAQPSGWTCPAGNTGINQCYRSCTTSDVNGSTSVSGTYYYSGSNTCAATSCAAGYYLSNGACTAQPSGWTCPAGNTGINQCYRSCTTSDINGSTSVSGTYYYSGSNTCAATACAENRYLSNGTCPTCSSWSSTYTLSANGNSSGTSACYRNCTTSDINGSTSVSGIYYSTGSNTCAATACAANRYLSNGTCPTCSSKSSTYTLSNGGAIDYNSCYRNVTRGCTKSNETASDGCTATSYNDCSCAGGTYIEYYNGTTSGTTSNETCTKTVKTVSAGTNRYVSGLTCPTCSSKSSTYTLSNGGAIDYNSCYRNVTRGCTKNNATCPSNATCTYNDCSCAGGTYIEYYSGATSGTTSNETCTKPVASSTCIAGYYLSNSTCTPCGVGTYKASAGNATSCAGADDGYYVATTAATSQTQCPSGYRAGSNGGRDEASDCYRNCTTDDKTGSYEVSGIYHYGGSNNCTATKCKASTSSVTGYYLSNGSCTACSALDSGFYWKKSGNDANGSGYCYGTTSSTKYVAEQYANETQCLANGYCPGGTNVSYGSTGGRTACNVSFTDSTSCTYTTNITKGSQYYTSGTKSRTCYHQTSPAGSDEASDCTGTQSCGSYGSCTGATLSTVTCEAGYYKNTSNTCSQCPENSYCPGGTWTASSSNAGITACNVSFTDYDSCTYTVSITKGSQYYVSGTKSRTCYHQTSPAGSDEASDCTGTQSCGSYGSCTGATLSTVTCEAGYYKNTSNTCSQCEANNYCPGGTWTASSSVAGKTACNVSFTDNGSDTETSGCGTRTRSKTRTCYHQTSPAGSTSSSACTGTQSCGGWGNYGSWSYTCTAAGCYYDSTNTTCATVPSGYYSGSGTNSATQCPSGYRAGSDGNRDSSATCYRDCTTSDVGNSAAVAGKYYNRSSNPNQCYATSCAANYYFANNACTSCTTVANTTSTTSGSESCTISNGTGTRTYTNTCAGYCTGGAGGTYGSGYCTGCSSWSRTTTGTCNVATCNAGYYKSNSTTCSVCPAGTYTTAGNTATSCTAVNPGYYNNGGGTNATGSTISGYSGGSVTAGYYNTGCGTNATGGVCNTTSYSGGEISSGYYCSAGAKKAAPTSASDSVSSSASCGACPSGGAGASDSVRNAIGKCYKSCSNTTVSHASPTSVAPDNAKVYYTGSAYPSCTYTPSCVSGYSATNGASPSCNANGYTVTYKAGTGGSGSDQTQNVTFDAKFTTKASNTFSKSNATFAGWSPSSGSYTAASTEYTYTTAGNVTLTATWTCDGGHYLNTSTGACDAVGSPYYSPSGDNSAYDCRTQAGSSYTASDGSRASKNDCYRSCTTADKTGSYEVSGTYHYSGTNTCAATKCKAHSGSTTGCII